MDRSSKTENQFQPSPEKPEQKANTSTPFTADMHVIVTRNKRNAWIDEMYETPPDGADLPVFN